MDTYLFTVILPVYQVEEYLAECIDSFVNQCGDDVQILLIDDGSSDGSPDILKEYEKRYRNIQVVTQQNSGVSKARNTGLAYAKGEYILWIDPDDWVSSCWMESIRSNIERSKPDMLFFDYTTYDNGKEQQITYGSGNMSIPVSKMMFDLTEDIALTSVLWNKVIRRKLFSGLRFDETLQCMEDAEILFKMIPQMEKIEYLSECLYYYRIRSGGLVLTPDLSVAYRCFQLAKERLNAVQALGFHVSKVGIYLQAKGFLCKYYRAGYPKEYRKQYQEMRTWLSEHRKEFLSSRNLGIKEKMKYLLIGNPLVGFGYAKAKTIQSIKRGIR